MGNFESKHRLIQCLKHKVWPAVRNAVLFMLALFCMFVGGCILASGGNLLLVLLHVTGGVAWLKIFLHYRYDHEL